MSRGNVLWATLLAGAAACSIDARDATSVEDLGAPGPVEQKFLCESSYTNFAMGYQHAGTYVDNEGHVYKYKAEKRIEPKQEDALTEGELEAKYSQGRELLRNVPPADVSKMHQLIAAASKGAYSKKVQRGADMGAVASSCYLYDAGPKTYREIELDVSGDWTYRNESPAARQLTAWLARISKP